MKRLMPLLLMILATIVWSGCFETKADYTINPDGSGKVTVEVTTAGMDGMMGNMNGKTPDGSKTARDIIQQATGVDTWKDVEFRVLDDGRNYFKGTAYFKNISNVKFKNAGAGDSIVVYQDAQKNWVLELATNPSKKSDKAKSGSEKIPTTDAEITKAVKEQKNGYNQMRPMLLAIMGTMKSEMNFRLPGKAQSSNNMTQQADGSYQVSFTGEKFIQVLDKLFADENWLKEQARAGANIKDNPPSGDAVNELLFGQKGPVRAVVSGKTAPQFNYEAEVSAAKAGYDAMIERLGLNQTESSATMESSKPERAVQSYQGGTFDWVKITRVTYSNVEDPDYLQFGTDQSYQVTFTGALPGAIVKTERAVVTAAIADNGQNLLHESEWYRETNYVEMSKQKDFLRWTLTLTVPDATAKGIKRIEGTVYAMRSTSTSVVDPGIRKFEKGAEGNQYGAVIEDIQDDEYTHQMVIRVGLPDFKLNKMDILDEKGNPVGISDRYISTYTEESTTMVLNLNTAVPKRGTINIHIHDDVEGVELPFVVENVNFLGQSMSPAVEQKQNKPQEKDLPRDPVKEKTKGKGKKK